MNLSAVSTAASKAAFQVVRSACPYCGVGCGVLATPQADGKVIVSPDPEHPANDGRLCVKGSALGETLSLDGRLLHPVIRDGGQSRVVSWDAALEKAATGLSAIIAEHGPDAVAFYVSGQMLTEDYYVANKLMKGYIGSANIDTNSRLCMASSVAGHKRAFGEDLVPGCYEDFDLADMVVLVGSNTAWCHPVLFQRILAAKAKRPQLKLVVIDPRRTATCEMADLHLPVKSGTDVWLFNGLLCYLARHGYVHTEFVNQHTNGFDAALSAAELDCGDPSSVADICGIALNDLLEFYQSFATTENVVTAYSQGVNQSSAGTDKVNSIINCHLIGGRIGRPGMGPFSLTGQPNAMGGREVGGLANMLAAHMELGSPQHLETVQSFWNSPTIASQAGLKAVELFQAIEQGKVKAVWIIATNPVVSLPDANQVKRALEKCELVIVSDNTENTDTTRLANVLLPALGWGEKDGTVTNSERCISRQRAFLQAPGEARADWQIICQVAQRMGYAGFDFAGPYDIFDEHARLSSYRNGSRPEPGHTPRMFDIGALAGLSEREYDKLDPIQWPVRKQPSDQLLGTPRLLTDWRFAHADGRARFVSTPPRAPVHTVDTEYPLVLNTGRVRDQWHTMTRTGKSATLAEHTHEPFVDMHPQDAVAVGLRSGDMARVLTRWGHMTARVQHSGDVGPGTIFVPIHWNDQNASNARAGAIVNPAFDPISGEPEFKHTPARVERFDVAWHGFILSRRPLALQAVANWVHIQGEACYRYELSDSVPVEATESWARELLGAADQHDDWLDYQDPGKGVYRTVHIVDNRIEQCIFLSTSYNLPARTWLSELFGRGSALTSADRAGLLIGRPLGQAVDAGPIVCSCFRVGRNKIQLAIQEHGFTSVKDVTLNLRAGSNCGSCLPEIKKLLMQSRRKAVGSAPHLVNNLNIE